MKIGYANSLKCEAGFKRLVSFLTHRIEELNYDSFTTHIHHLSKKDRMDKIIEALSGVSINEDVILYNFIECPDGIDDAGLDHRVAEVVNFSTLDTMDIESEYFSTGERSMVVTLTNNIATVYYKPTEVIETTTCFYE